jgi:hypothetical protein
MVESNLKSLWQKFDDANLKISNFLIEKISNLNIQTQALVQNIGSKIELIRKLDELAAQNSIQGDELKRCLNEMLDKFFTKLESIVA